MSELEELERRVIEKWMGAAAQRAPLWPLPDDLFNPDEWDINLDDWAINPVPPSGPQFPREQWLVYPNKRQITLLICDQALDRDLSEDEWMHVCLLMMYGGKERVA